MSDNLPQMLGRSSAVGEGDERTTHKFTEILNAQTALLDDLGKPLYY